MYSDNSIMSHNLHGTFVSEKIHKIRWRPNGLHNSNYFVTGSIDNHTNTVKLWDFCEHEEDDDIYPFPIFSFPYKGDILDIQFLNSEYFVCASSLGSAHLFSINTKSDGDLILNNCVAWDNLHYFQNYDTSPCTALAVYENDLVTVGEDGKINILTSQSKNVIRTIENADSCSIGCVLFLKHNEILTSNLRGQMK
ncbi:hypothetical protein GWI33_010728, partial [Rhynchophorus ferrugineus]